MVIKMRIAIIDDEASCSNPEIRISNINILERNSILPVDSKDTFVNCDSHADKCIKIIQKYLIKKNGTEFINIVIKDCGTGRVDYFLRALEIVSLLDVDFLCLSLGTIYHVKIKRMHKLIKKIAKKGVVIVCAISNTGKKTYPACFKEVIKCRANNSIPTVIKQKTLFELRGSHIIRDNNNKVYMTTNSNSFAAAYMVALLANDAVQDIIKA